MKSFEPWKDKCDVAQGRACLVSATSVCPKSRFQILCTNIGRG